MPRRPAGEENGGNGEDPGGFLSPQDLDEIHHVLREDHHHFIRLLQRLRLSRGRQRETHSPDRDAAFRAGAEALLRFLFLRLGEEARHDEIQRLLRGEQTAAERQDLARRMDLHLHGDPAGRDAWAAFFEEYERGPARSETERSLIARLPTLLGQVGDRVTRIQRSWARPLFEFDNSGRGICVLRSRLLARGHILIGVSGMVEPARVLLEFRGLNRRLEIGVDLPSPRLIGARILRANLLVGDHDIGLSVLAQDAEALADLALFIQSHFAQAHADRSLPAIQMSTKSYVLSRYYFYRDFHLPVPAPE